MGYKGEEEEEKEEKEEEDVYLCATAMFLPQNAGCIW